MNSKYITIKKGIIINLCLDIIESKIKVKKKSLETVKQLLSIEDWEWFYLGLYLKKDSTITNEHILNIFIKSREECGITINYEEAIKIVFKNSYIVEKIIYKIKKIQRWFRKIRRDRAVRYIQNWWLHYYYKPSSNLGIIKAEIRFNKTKKILIKDSTNV